jgi:hypothetical protein
MPPKREQCLKRRKDKRIYCAALIGRVVKDDESEKCKSIETLSTMRYLRVQCPSV